MKEVKPTSQRDLIRLFMAGDVMTGRGIDQILPHPGNGKLHEPAVKDAMEYVELAEKANGPIPRSVPYDYIWGDALGDLRKAHPDVRMVNLETSVTESEEYWEGKEEHYKMHPENVASLTAAGIDYTALANNHVLDWGYAGLEETIREIRKARIGCSGAGEDLGHAVKPEIIEVEDTGRVIIYSWGTESSGIPLSWAADTGKPGVNLLPEVSLKAVRWIKDHIAGIRRDKDLVIASLHWENEWGYDIPPAQVEFAHRLIDEAGVDIIHGHSSHHPKPLEVYKGKLILYGAGDFINDTEGVPGHETFRSDLALMYLADLDPRTGKLFRLQMKPLVMKRFQLHDAPRQDAEWLKNTLNREAARIGTRIRLAQDNVLILQLD